MFYLTLQTTVGSKDPAKQQNATDEEYVVGFHI